MGSITSRSGSHQITWGRQPIDAASGASIRQSCDDVRIEALAMSDTKRVCNVFVDPSWSELIETKDVHDDRTGITFMLARSRRRSVHPAFTSITVIIERETSSHLTWNQVQYCAQFADGREFTSSNIVPDSFPGRSYDTREVSQVRGTIQLATQLLFNMDRELKRMTLQFAAEVGRLLPAMLNEPHT